jgi:hypothetical protein
LVCCTKKNLATPENTLKTPPNQVETLTGWPDWVNFRQSAIVYFNQFLIHPKIMDYFFHSKSYVFI